MAIVGITGLPGTGKSFMSNYLNSLTNFYVIDADKIGHELLTRDDVIEFITENYPTVIENEKVVRGKLAEIVFKDYKAYKFYNDFISKLMKQYILEFSFDKLQEVENVVLDAALIFEWGIESIFDVIVYCEANEKKRVVKIEARGDNIEDYKKREQMLIDEYIKIDQSDIVIYNKYDDDFIQEVKTLNKKIAELS